MGMAASIAGTGQEAFKKCINIISGNIANMNTTAFKAQIPHLSDTYYQEIRAAGTKSSDSTTLPSGYYVGLGTIVTGTGRDFTQGDMKPSTSSLHVFVEGDGWFQVTLDDGTTAYTRDGSFTLNADGNIVTSGGYVLGSGIQIDSTSGTVSISQSGKVSQGSTEKGQIELAMFINNNGLKPIGENLFIESDASGSPITGNPNTDSFGKLQGSNLEGSNVNSITEVNKLIEFQRAFELCTNAARVDFETDKTITDLRV